MENPTMPIPTLRMTLLAATLLTPLAEPLLAQGQPARQAANTAMMDHCMPNATFTLRTGIAQGKMVYIGKGGAIEGQINPTLTVHEGDTVQITLVNGEGAEHDINLPDLRLSYQPTT